MLGCSEPGAWIPGTSSRSSCQTASRPPSCLGHHEDRRYLQPHRADLSATELRHILGQARTKVAIVPESFRGHNFRDMYELLRGELPALTEVLVVGAGDGSRDGHRWHGGTSDHAEPEVSEAVPVDPDDIALLMYTSGTTAVPKGVLHSHNTFLFTAHLLAELFSLDEDVFLNVSPVTHITGLLNGVVLPAVAAATVVHQPVWDPIQALATIKRERCRTDDSTPFLRGFTAAVAEGADTSSLRYIGCGGAVLPVQLMRRLPRSSVWGSCAFTGLPRARSRRPRIAGTPRQSARQPRDDGCRPTTR